MDRVFSLDARILAFSFKGPADEGAFATGDRICMSVAAFAGQRVVPIEERLESGAKTFSLADQPVGGDEDCTSTGLADAPAWSPDGTSLALLAAPSAVGVDGTDRLDVPWNLYVVDSDSPPKLIVNGIGNRGEVAWDPSGRWIAFGARLQSHGTGTWIIEADTGRLVRASPLLASKLGWSPDGSSLAIVHFPDLGQPKGDVLRLDVQKALAP
jgi:Tol biopolymer transport system component